MICPIKLSDNQAPADAIAMMAHIVNPSFINTNAMIANTNATLNIIDLVKNTNAYDLIFPVIFFIWLLYIYLIMQPNIYNKNMKIVITGLTSSGKSTCLDQPWDFNVYKMDDIVKYWYKTNKVLIAEVKAAFGETVIYDKTVSIRELGIIVLQDKDKLKELDKIVYPFVKAFIEECNDDIAIFEMAAYIGNEELYKDLIDKVILIERQKRNLDEKFNYIDGKVDPIEKTSIKYDVLIKNDSTIFAGQKQLKAAITKLTSS